MFVKAVNTLLENKAEIIANVKLIKDTLFDTSALENKKENLHKEMSIQVDLIQTMVSENAKKVQNQEVYQEKYNSLVANYEKTKTAYETVENQISDILVRHEIMSHFIKTLKNQDELITEFDSALWGSLLDYITVYSDEDIRFTFKDGNEIKI